jgi:hypothetical protein
LLELIPDAIPIIGNLDEAAATTLVLWGLQAFRKPDDPPALPIPSQKYILIVWGSSNTAPH